MKRFKFAVTVYDYDGVTEQVILTADVATDDSELARRATDLLRAAALEITKELSLSLPEPSNG